MVGPLAAPEFSASYAAAALFLGGSHFYNQRVRSRRVEGSQRESHRPQLISHSTSTTACFGTLSSSASATTLTGCAAGLTSSGLANVFVARMLL